MSKHQYHLLVVLQVSTDGGRADAEALSDEVYDALVSEISSLVLDGTAPHATKDDDVEWTAEITDVVLSE